MQKKIALKITPQEAADKQLLLKQIALATAVNLESISGYHTLKHSIDARSRQQIWVNITLQVYINEPFEPRTIEHVKLQAVENATKKVIVVGAGPAGLFAALKLAQLGIQPIVIERGKDVRARRRDLANLNKEGIVNPESNYCFGEGGAGTYSDGKLYTRSNKRGSIDKILNLFVQFGAEEKILYQSHPHIGTNKLPQIIVAMREAIIACGGIILFEKKLSELLIQEQTIQGIKTTDGDCFKADAVILATGHSARDIFSLLHQQKITVEAKPFALGVRIEHPQNIIDAAQYHCSLRTEFLPPAAYTLVEQIDGKGVFSFCMCPGGIIAPAATSPGELVVNGWSPSKRNNPYANSGMVVSVENADAFTVLKKAGYKPQQNDPLLLMRFQQMIEQAAFKAGGGKLVAPANRLVDFCMGKTSQQLPNCSYIPGLVPNTLQEVLPPFILSRLQDGFKAFGKKINGFYTNEAVVVATESRTSSPVRIPRDLNTLQHPQIKKLYPCGEGAGYAGGIVSAAMDGEKVALAIAISLGIVASNH
jgi:uncharacterized protein